tara:strand:- start:456 stop:1568 length:1113 start_codon:yes stop_codon:yes gene_type:complete
MQCQQLQEVLLQTSLPTFAPTLAIKASKRPGDEIHGADAKRRILNILNKEEEDFVNFVRDGDAHTAYTRGFQSIEEFSVYYQDVNEKVDGFFSGGHTDAAMDTVCAIVHASCNKILVDYFYLKDPQRMGALKDALLRPASRPYWRRDYDMVTSALNLQRDKHEFVLVDLWHASRNTDFSFREFKEKHAYFFVASADEMQDMIGEGDIDDYIGEGEEGEDNMFVKRGRFLLNPLLWYEDKRVTSLMEDAKRRFVVNNLIMSHACYKQGTVHDKKFLKRALYQRRFPLGKQGNNLEVRLDNNCAGKASIPLAAGFNATLCVDVSGIAAAVLPPGQVKKGAIQSESVVLWDVPGTLQEEWEWEKVVAGGRFFT